MLLYCNILLPLQFVIKLGFYKDSVISRPNFLPICILSCQKNKFAISKKILFHLPYSCMHKAFSSEVFSHFLCRLCHVNFNFQVLWFFVLHQNNDFAHSLMTRLTSNDQVNVFCESKTKMQLTLMNRIYTFNLKVALKVYKHRCY